MVLLIGSTFLLDCVHLKLCLLTCNNQSVLAVHCDRQWCITMYAGSMHAFCITVID